MEDTISNRKCKDCKWFTGTKCSEQGRIETNIDLSWDYYRNYRRMPYDKACKRFEEKEENMDIEKTIKDCENALENISYTIDKLEEQLVEEPTISEESDTPINKYGIGETLYLPVKVVGIRSRKTPNGGDIILYELRTTTDQRIGFKIFENPTDIWHDKDHYMVSIPEGYIRDHFKKG